MKRYLVLLSVIAMAVALGIVTAGIAFSKAHVPVNQVQVCHKGTVKNVDAPALQAHLSHGDIRLPACDFDNVFFEGGDCSGVTDADGDGLADLPAPGAVDPLPDLTGNACGITPACPAGGPGGPKLTACF